MAGQAQDTITDQREAVKDIADKFVRQILEQRGVALTPGGTAVDWMAAQIPRLCLFDEATKEGISVAMGSLLGESIVAVHSGQWDFSEHEWAVKLPSGIVMHPVAAVRAQFAGGTSIASVFGSIAEYNSGVDALNGSLYFGAAFYALGALLCFLLLLLPSPRLAQARWSHGLMFVGVLAVTAALSALAAHGMSGKPKLWVRRLSFGLGLFYLIAFPIGTALGIWILVNLNKLAAEEPGSTPPHLLGRV